MFSFAIKHISDETQYPNFVPSVAHGTSDGRIKPLVAHFDIRLPYVVDEENGTARKTMTGLFPSGKYSDLNYTPVFSPNRFLGWGSKPYDAEVEYLESIGTQYIDTGIKVENLTYAKYDIQYTSTTPPDNTAMQNGIVRLVSGSTYNQFVYSMQGAARTVQIFTGTVANARFISPHNDLNRNTAEFNIPQNTLKFNSTVVNVSYNNDFGGRNIYLFARNYNDVAQHFCCEKLYSAVFVENGVEHILVPVRVGVEGCLYDKVTGTIFRNQGTGAFLYGDDIAVAKSMDSSTKIFYDVPEVHAKWQPPAKITFNATANGGSMPSWEHFYYETLPYGTLPSVNDRSHYYYEGWFTSASGGTKITTSSVVPASATLYAQWTAAVSVTFDATTNGGTMPSDWASPDYYPGHPYGQLPTPTHPSLNFSGWYLNGERVTASSIVPSGGATLVAVYVASYYSVDLNDSWLDPYQPSTETYGEGGEYTEPYTPPENPNPEAYDGPYESIQDGSQDLTRWARIHVVGYTTFTIKIMSISEEPYDYTVALEADVNPNEQDYYPGYDMYSYEGVKASTNDGTRDWVDVVYELDGGEHDIWVGYTKDGSVNGDNDRGYFMIDRGGSQ